MSETETTASAADIDRWTRHLWHTSQHNRMVIGLAGRLQTLANEMRATAGLPEFGWNTSFPDAEFGECSAHMEDCAGQETHPEYAALMRPCLSCGAPASDWPAAGCDRKNEHGIALDALGLTP